MTDESAQDPGVAPRATTNSSRCAKARSPSPCRRSSTPRFILSVASARRGKAASNVRRTRGNPTRSARSNSIRAGRQALKGSRPSRHVLLLYWMDRTRRDLVLQCAAALWRTARHVCIALAGATQSDRDFSGAACPHRRQHAFSQRRRLPRQHAASRHQAIFCFDGFRSRSRGRLARAAPTLSESSTSERSSARC